MSTVAKARAKVRIKRTKRLVNQAKCSYSTKQTMKKNRSTIMSIQLTSMSTWRRSLTKIWISKWELTIILLLSTWFRQAQTLSSMINSHPRSSVTHDRICCLYSHSSNPIQSTYRKLRSMRGILLLNNPHFHYHWEDPENCVSKSK